MPLLNLNSIQWWWITLSLAWPYSSPPPRLYSCNAVKRKKRYSFLPNPTLLIILRKSRERSQPKRNRPLLRRNNKDSSNRNSSCQLLCKRHNFCRCRRAQFQQFLQWHQTPLPYKNGRQQQQCWSSQHRNKVGDLCVFVSDITILFSALNSSIHAVVHANAANRRTIWGHCQLPTEGHIRQIWSVDRRKANCPAAQIHLS